MYDEAQSIRNQNHEFHASCLLKQAYCLQRAESYAASYLEYGWKDDLTNYFIYTARAKYFGAQAEIEWAGLVQSYRHQQFTDALIRRANWLIDTMVSVREEAEEAKELLRWDEEFWGGSYSELRHRVDYGEYFLPRAARRLDRIVRKLSKMEVSYL